MRRLNPQWYVSLVNENRTDVELLYRVKGKWCRDQFGGAEPHPLRLYHGSTRQIFHAHGQNDGYDRWSIAKVTRGHRLVDWDPSSQERLSYQKSFRCSLVAALWLPHHPLPDGCFRAHYLMPIEYSVMRAACWCQAVVVTARRVGTSRCAS